MTVPPGARSGTLSHAESTNAGTTATVERQRRLAQADEKDCASMEKPDVFAVMSLRDLRRHDGERGYAMAALLVALAIMAILLSVAMPVWRHEAQREKEAELVFRGEQYARAIALFRFKNANIANAFPPSIDSLVEGRYLRKKYKDPMTKDGEFVLIGVGSAQPGINPPPAQPGRPRRFADTAAGSAGCRRHDGRPQQERGKLHPQLSGRDALRPVAVHVQHRPASRRRDADGQLRPTAGATLLRERTSPAAFFLVAGGRRPRSPAGRSGGRRRPGRTWSRRCRAWWRAAALSRRASSLAAVNRRCSVRALPAVARGDFSQWRSGSTIYQSA